MASFATKLALEALDEIASQREMIRQDVDYWESIRPKDTSEKYLRWIFAFTSVAVSYSINCRAYVALRDLYKESGNALPCKPGPRNTIEDDVLLELINSGVGLQHMRRDGIAEFTIQFRENPDVWSKQRGESFVDMRNRLETKLYGLGLAKTAFAIEMIYPEVQDVTCLDTHMLQLYGIRPKTSAPRKLYKEIEAHWCTNCSKRNMPSAIARHIYWNIVQNQPDSKYWTYVFEKA